eukprot:scaffold1051_cov254-Pinguiococcus_pyrenoidosus.AAC.6
MFLFSGCITTATTQAKKKLGACDCANTWSMRCSQSFMCSRGVSMSRMRGQHHFDALQGSLKLLKWLKRSASSRPSRKSAARSTGTGGNGSEASQFAPQRQRNAIVHSNALSTSLSKTATNGKTRAGRFINELSAKAGHHRDSADRTNFNLRSARTDLSGGTPVKSSCALGCGPSLTRLAKFSRHSGSRRSSLQMCGRHLSGNRPFLPRDLRSRFRCRTSPPASSRASLKSG